MSRMSACGLKELLARLILAPELLFPLGIFGFQIKISSFFFLSCILQLQMYPVGCMKALRAFVGWASHIGIGSICIPFIKHAKEQVFT